jgi:hypothetical protein
MRRKSREDGFKSNFEKEVFTYFDKKLQYEPDKIHFTQPAVARTYLPDFKLKEGVYLETKGKLTVEDRKKHLWIKEQHPEITIIFLFMNSTNKLTRKSPTTYAMWAEDNDIPWFCWRTKIPPKNIKELIKQCTYTKQLKQTMGQSSSRENSRRKKSPSSLSSLSTLLSKKG